jgi:hypothetical protein
MTEEVNELSMSGMMFVRELGMRIGLTMLNRSSFYSI